MLSVGLGHSRDMLWCTEGGHGDGPTLLLLHGLSGTAELWSGVIGETPRWPGRWLAVDLAGHGRSPRLANYSLGNHAAAVAETLRPRATGPLVVLGHSLGGVVGLALATGWFGVDVVAAVGLGMKCAWGDDDFASMAILRAKGSRTFATAAEAAERFVANAGLRGLIEPADPRSQAGIREVGTGWELAHDPASFPDWVPPTAELIRLSAGPVVLAVGAQDAMVTASELSALVPGTPVEVLAGAGHNAQVEAPAATLDLALAALARRAAPAGNAHIGPAAAD